MIHCNALELLLKRIHAYVYDEFQKNMIIEGRAQFMVLLYIKNRYTYVFMTFCASIHQADGCLKEGSREASKPRDSGLDFSNRSDIWHISTSAGVLPRCLSNFKAIRSL